MSLSSLRLVDVSITVDSSSDVSYSIDSTSDKLFLVFVNLFNISVFLLFNLIHCVSFSNIGSFVTVFLSVTEVFLIPYFSLFIDDSLCDDTSSLELTLFDFIFFLAFVFFNGLLFFSVVFSLYLFLFLFNLSVLFVFEFILSLSIFFVFINSFNIYTIIL